MSQDIKNSTNMQSSSAIKSRSNYFIPNAAILSTDNKVVASNEAMVSHQATITALLKNSRRQTAVNMPGLNLQMATRQEFYDRTWSYGNPNNPFFQYCIWLFGYLLNRPLVIPRTSTRSVLRILDCQAAAGFRSNSVSVHPKCMKWHQTTHDTTTIARNLV